MTRPERTTAWASVFCGRDRQARLATFRFLGGAWQLSSVSDQPAGGGNPGQVPVTGNFAISPQYRGCPACGNDNLVQCDGCGALSCWRSGTAGFRCGGCGRAGTITGEIESVNALDAG
jgi:hypothetical protein